MSYSTDFEQAKLSVKLTHSSSPTLLTDLCADDEIHHYYVEQLLQQCRFSEHCKAVLIDKDNYYIVHTDDEEIYVLHIVDTVVCYNTPDHTLESALQSIQDQMLLNHE